MDSLETIAQEIALCQRCALREHCTQPVPGIGNLHAKYVLIGEAPGREEDEAGIPFVGMSGRRLDKLIELANIDPNECYLTNVCRCRPPENRTPKKKEVRECQKFLWAELKIIKPKIVIPLGSTALALFSEYGITQMHGTEFEYEFAD
jgi:DNA polymerase